MHAVRIGLAWCMVLVAAAGAEEAPPPGRAPAAGEAAPPPDVKAAAPAPRDCLPPPPVAEPAEDPLEEALRHYARGQTLMESRDYVRAAEELERAALYAPQMARIWLRLGEARYESGDLAAAGKALDKALECGPADPETLCLSGRAAQGLGDSDKALSFFQKVLDTAPRDSPYRILALYYLAGIHQEQRDLDAAVEDLQAMLALLAAPDPAFRNYPEVYMLYRRRAQLAMALARLYLVRSETDKALGVLREVAAAQPDDPEVVGLLYHACIQARNYDGARDAARKLIEISPETGTGYQRLVEAYRAEGRADDGVRELEALHEKQPGNQVLAFQLAAIYETAGQDEKALALYHAIAARPDDPTGTGAAAAIKEADLLERQKRPVDAIEALGLAVTGRRNEAAVLIRAARLIDALESPVQVFDQARRLVGDDQKSPGPFVLVGMLAERIKQMDDAIALYDKAIQRQPKAAIAYSRKADLLIRADNLAEALATYQKAIDVGLDLPIFQRKMGLILERLNRDEEALEHYRKARRGAPDDQPTRYLLTATLFRLGRAQEAEDELRQALADFPDDVEVRCQLAGLALVGGKVAEAEKLLQDALARDPESLGAKALMGEVRFVQQRFDEAERLARDVLAVTPGTHEVRLLLARTLVRLGRTPDAIKEVRALLAAEPENLSWRYFLAGLYQQAGDNKAAEDELLAILKKKPDHAPSNNDLGYLWADRGVNLTRAEQMIRQALKADPQSPAYLDSLGWVLYKRGQLEDSAKALQQATQLAPELDSVLWDHLGDAFWRLSRARDASAAWQRAADILRKQGEDARKEELQRLQMKVKSVESGKAPDVAPLGATPQGDAEPPAGQPK